MSGHQLVSRSTQWAGSGGEERWQYILQRTVCTLYVGTEYLARCSKDTWAVLEANESRTWAVTAGLKVLGPICGNIRCAPYTLLRTLYGYTT